MTDPASIAASATHPEAEHGHVDIVASNAAARIAKDAPQSGQVRGFVATNSHGSRELVGALEPILSENARYAMVASSFGRLSRLDPRLRPLFDTEIRSLDEIEEAMDRYVEAAEAGRASEDGWPDWIDIPSKVGRVATALVAAREISKSRPEDGILVNADCPGLMDTEASRPWFDDMSGAASSDEAAVPVVDFPLTGAGTTRPSGQLVQFGRILPWL